VFVVFALFFRGARARMEVLAQSEPQLAESNQVFRHPIASALVLTWLTTGWMDRAHQPPLVDLAFGLLFLVPGLRLLAALVGPELRGAPWIIAVLVGIDSIREFVSLVPDLEQTIVVLQIGIVVASLAVLLRTGRLAGVELTPAEAKAIRPLGYGARIAIFVSLVALVAVAFGYLQIGRLLGRGIFALLVAMMILYAALRAIDGLVAFALRTRPLTNLHMVERYRGLIESRLEGVFQRTATVLVGALFLLNFHLWTPTLDLLKGIANIDLSPGENEVTVGHVALFVVTCVAAVQVSRFLRFVLEEDVYPRFNVGRGVDYSISSLLHYVVLGLGFVVAVSWIGFDMNKVTVLGGAFAVGIGFGLQNIVNNFVSGLILLFERPIQIGDAVQIADVVGEVRRIGIRSSTLRTLEGAEVIVPNATLISDRVTNWTLSDRTRRVTIDVGVP
jgi:small-conductance mechanosensitive channel